MRSVGGHHGMESITLLPVLMNGAKRIYIYSFVLDEWHRLLGTTLTNGGLFSELTFEVSL